MMDFQIRNFSLGCLLAVQATSAALAQEAPYTFNVAVDVKELHRQVTALHVRCAVYEERNGSAIGLGEAQRPVENRAYTGTVPVAVSMSPGRAPEEARRYACRLRLVLAASAPQKVDADARNVALRPKSGTTFTPLVAGDLPTN